MSKYSNRQSHSQPREVIFEKIERPYGLRNRLVYLFECFVNVITRTDGHVYEKLVDVQINEDFINFERSTIIYLSVWECIDCHYRQMMIMKEDRYYS